jgi:hypothetical protein
MTTLYCAERKAVSLGQRAQPLIQLMERTLWEASGDF